MVGRALDRAVEPGGRVGRFVAQGRYKRLGRRREAVSLPVTPTGRQGWAAPGLMMSRSVLVEQPPGWRVDQTDTD